MRSLRRARTILDAIADGKVAAPAENFFADAEM